MVRATPRSLISAISAAAFLTAYYAGMVSLEHLNYSIAQIIGKILFISLGIWIIFTSVSPSPKIITSGKCSLAEIVIVGLAVATDAFIVGIAIAATFNGSPLWSLYLWLIGMIFLLTGQLIGRLSFVPKTKLTPLFQGLFFVIWGIFI